MTYMIVNPIKHHNEKKGVKFDSELRLYYCHYYFDLTLMKKIPIRDNFIADMSSELPLLMKTKL